MYEIHINAGKIYLLKKAWIDKIPKRDGQILVEYSGKKKMLLNYIDKLEKSPDSVTIYIYAQHLDPLKKVFFSLFDIIIASGGLVLNPEGKILMIFRRGSWDLPKGKRESGEKKKQTAIREVKEETGINDLQLLQPLPDTFHTYHLGKQRVLKVSHWYLMESNDTKLIPQKNEDIEKAEWIDLKTSLKLKPIYPNISNLLVHYSLLLKNLTRSK